jgi:hypothetical protein
MSEQNIGVILEKLDNLESGLEKYQASSEKSFDEQVKINTDHVQRIAKMEAESKMSRAVWSVLGAGVFGIITSFIVLIIK